MSIFTSSKLIKKVMGKFYTFFKNNKTKFLSLLLFSLGIAAIMLIFPKERKFNYEYQQNKVWLHKDLFAPFSFSIDKTEDEIKRQHDSLLVEFSPYYILDTTVYKKTTDSIFLSFMHYYSYYIHDSVKNFKTMISNQNLYDFEKVLLELFKIGIINNQKPYKTLIVQNNVERSRVALQDVYTLPEAHNLAILAIPHSYDSAKRRQLKQIIYKAILPNVIYNDSISYDQKQQLLSKISEKYGLITQGSRIISRGSIVTAQDVKILDSLKKEYESSEISLANKFAIIMGQFLLVLVSFLVLILLISHAEPELLRNYRSSLFIVSAVVLFVLLAGITLKFNHVSIYFVPYLALPILIKNFVNARIGFYVHSITMLIIGFLAPNSFDFVFLQISVGAIVLFSIENHYQRSYLFASAMIAFVSYSIIYVGFSLIKNGTLVTIPWIPFAWFGVSCIMLLTTYLLIFIFERVFRLSSDLTLFELSDTNRGLLRELSENAPGTFQHSLQVANLTEVALRKIGGNALLGRVGGLYHDIGKLSAPAFFIENQSFVGNPHDTLSPEESARIIINHVIYGRELARIHNLPHAVAEIIYGHHGPTKTEYFLTKSKNINPENEVDEQLFQYPSPPIFSKELAVLLIADTVEAASRSVVISSKKDIEELVQKRIDHVLKNNFLEHANITLKEIFIVKEVLIQKLITMYHARIPYPEKIMSK